MAVFKIFFRFLSFLVTHRVKSVSGKNTHQKNEGKCSGLYIFL